MTAIHSHIMPVASAATTRSSSISQYTCLTSAFTERNINFIVDQTGNTASYQKIRNTYNYVIQHWQQLFQLFSRFLLTPETFPTLYPLRFEPGKGVFFDIMNIAIGSWKTVSLAAYCTPALIPVAHLQQSFTENERENRRDRYTMAKKELEIVSIIPPSADRIIKHYFGFETPTSIHFVHEFASGGSLINHLCHQCLRVEEIHQFALDILQGLVQLYSYGIVHNDIKPENILITLEFDESLRFCLRRAKISDFGLSFFSNTLWCPENGATIEYAAPELLHQPPNPQNDKIDPFAYGSTLLSMLKKGIIPWQPLPTKTQPWRDERNNQIAHYVSQLKTRKLPLDLFLATLLDPNPDTRATVIEAQKNIKGLTSDDFGRWSDRFDPAPRTTTTLTTTMKSLPLTQVQ